VVEAPQRGVGDALVVPLDLQGGQRDGDEVHAVVVARFELLVGGTVPSQPCAATALPDRRDGGHQSAGPAAPLALADPVHGEPVGDDEKGASFLHASSNGGLLSTLRKGHMPLLGGYHSIRAGNR